MRWTKMALAGLAMWVAAVPAGAAELIANGNFGAGLTNWTSYVTPNGAANPTPATFNVTGTGDQSAVRLEVGQVVFPGFGGPPAGGGVFQLTNVAQAGLYTFRADFAVSVLAPFNNASGGIFSLVHNGVAVATFDTAEILGGTVERGALNVQINVGAGLNSFGVQATRPFQVSAGNNLYQYFTNVSVANAAGAVPEPATWAMLLLGFGVLGAAIRRRPAGRPALA